MTFLAAQKYVDAVGVFAKAVELEPDSGYNYYGRGVAQAQIGARTEARSDLAKAVTLIDAIIEKKVLDAENRLGAVIFHATIGNIEMARYHMDGLLAMSLSISDLHTFIALIDVLVDIFPGDEAGQQIIENLGDELQMRSTHFGSE